MEIQFLYILASILNFKLLEIVPTLLRNQPRNQPAGATVTELPYMTQLNGCYFEK